jgi:lipid-binding SYLF domain-containing protein
MLKVISAAAVAALVLLAPVLAQDDPTAKEVADTIASFKKTDATLARWFDSAHGYAVFPSVGKGAVVVGGGGGGGQVFEKGAHIGHVRMTFASIGAQIGGQSFSEVIFFENQAALDRFKGNKFEWAAGMSAVAAATGTSKDAKYREGVAVFTMAKKGLMAEASVGGQKFKFTPTKK